jgi:hypothetical protein
LLLVAAIFAQTAIRAQSTYIFPGNILSGSFGPWGGTGYFYEPTFNVNAAGGIDITYYDIDLSQLFFGNTWELKGYAQPGISKSGSMTSIDPLANSIWAAFHNQEIAAGTDWNGTAISTLGPDGLPQTNDDTRHGTIQDWYKPASGGKVNGPGADISYNNESYVTPNPRYLSATAKTASELNTYDFRLRVLPSGSGTYTYEMWTRMHNAASNFEGCGYCSNCGVWNHAISNCGGTNAWRAFENGGNTVFPITGFDLSAVYLFMGLGNGNTASSQALTWGCIEVTGTPAQVPTTLYVNASYTSCGSNDGYLFGYNAFATIQAAINAANPDGGDVIEIAAGIYYESSGGGTALLVNKSVTITGAGKATYDGAGLWTGGTLITRGPGAGGQALNQVVEVSASSVSIGNLTIDGRYGFSAGSTTNYGIFISGQSITLTGIDVVDATNSAIELNGANNAVISNVLVKRTAFAPGYYAEFNGGLRCVSSEYLSVDGFTAENVRRGIVVFQQDNSGTLKNVTIIGNGNAAGMGFLFSTAPAPGWWNPAWGDYEGNVTFTLDGSNTVSNLGSGVFVSDYLTTKDITLTIASGATFNFHNNVVNGGYRVNQGSAPNIDAVMAAMGLTIKTTGPPDLYNYPPPSTTIVPVTPTVCGTYDFDVKVTGFTNVGAISLVLNYDITKLDYISFTQNTLFSSGIVLQENTPGELRMSYFSNTGVTLPDDDVLLTLKFNLLPSASGIPTNLTWSTVSGECEYAEPGLDGEVYVTTFTNLPWTIPVRPVKNMNTLLEYCKIQDAIDALPTDNLHVIAVAAGVYAENIIVHKSLDIRGPKYGIAGNDGSRGTGEAIVVPAVIAAGGDIFNVTVSNVLIDGFTLDGNNPMLTSGWIGTNGADIDAGKGISISTSNVNNLKIKNNIIQNLSYFGVFFYGAAGSDANASKTGHLIEANLFRDLGHYNTGNGYDSWGGGASIVQQSLYTRVINNVMTNVRIRIQTGNYQTTHIGDPQYQVIDNNQYPNKVSWSFL